MNSREPVWSEARRASGDVAVYERLLEKPVLVAAEAAKKLLG